MSDTPPPLPDDPHWTEADPREPEKNQAKGRIFPCTQCGADVVFHIGSQQLRCPFCGFQRALKIDVDAEIAERDYLAELERIREFKEQEASEVAGLKEVHCDACNGNVVFTGTLTSTHCPYCASPIQLDKIHELETRITPDGVLPFQVDERKGRRSLAEWVKSRWFAPNDFKKQGIKGELQGVYLPYWTYDSLTTNAYTGQRGETYTVTVGTGKNRRTETRVRWYPASGRFQRFFDDVLVVGSGNMSRELIRGLEPWPLGKTLPFTREALAGYVARTYDVTLDRGFKVAKERIDSAVRSDVTRRIGGDRQRIHSIKTAHSAVTFKLLILPVWMLAYRYKGKVYQVLINAATGQVSGQRPWSPWKIAFAILAALIVVGGLWLGANFFKG